MQGDRAVASLRPLKLAAIVLGLAIAVPGQARAGESEVHAVDATELISAFGTICLDHLGDSNAQITAARGAPWNFEPDEDRMENVAAFRSDLGVLGVGNSSRMCILTAEMDSQVRLASVQALLAQSLSLDEGSPLEEPVSVYWLIAPNDSDEQFVLALKVSDWTGRNLATLTVQSRMSLNQ